MKVRKVGWCRIKEELVLDADILNMPWLQDDMDVYTCDQKGYWTVWTPERQGYVMAAPVSVPEVIKLAMMMLS